MSCRKIWFFVFICLIWILTNLVLKSLRSGYSCMDDIGYKKQINQEHSKLAELQRKHRRLKNTLITRNFTKNKVSLKSPSTANESLRRRIYKNIQELWNYINYQMNSILNGNVGDKIEKLKSIMEDIRERKRSLLEDMKRIREVDGYNKWREQEAAEVSDLIQRRLRYLQNPADCKTAKKLVCELPYECGFGCQLHHMIYCLIHAYATERTFILNSTRWRYNEKGWEDMFHPLSDTCTSVYGVESVAWPSNESQVVFVRIHHKFYINKPEFLPFALPEDMAQRIIRFNGDPVSWWISQILKYVLRPNADTQKAIDNIVAKINFKAPIVGIQIRRTDKLAFKEANYHDLKEYIAHVEEYYNTLEMTHQVQTRRVYIASDSIKVFKEAQLYPLYTLLRDPSIASLAAAHSRYTPQALIGVLVDLQLLARSSHLVCTFTSNMCRIAYELMQASRLDASDDVTSIDVMYYFRKGSMMNPALRVAVMAHSPLSYGTKRDISLRRGDVIELQSPGYYFNGYGRGTNMRTKESGQFPWYKTANHVRLYKFPAYENVNGSGK